VRQRGDYENLPVWGSDSVCRVLVRLDKQDMHRHPTNGVCRKRHAQGSEPYSSHSQGAPSPTSRESAKAEPFPIGEDTYKRVRGLACQAVGWVGGKLETWDDFARKKDQVVSGHV